MKCLYTSDLHREIRLYQELLSLAISSLSEIIGIGGDLLPSFPPTKRYEDMVPNQKTFIDHFLSPFFERMLETTSIQQIFVITGNWVLGYSFLFREKTDTYSSDTLVFLRPRSDQKTMRRCLIGKLPGLLRRTLLIFIPPIRPMG